MPVKIDQVIRSDRRTIAIVVRADGVVIVRAPRRATDGQIAAFVAQKEAWIVKTLARAGQRRAQTAPRRFADGETLPYLGRALPLHLVDAARPALRFTGETFLLSRAAQPRAAELLSAWYRRQARVVLEERARLHAARFKLAYQKVRITAARTRWGSCSSLGTLSFTWRLVMAPLPVIDYVVIHELAHLLEKNHSSRFWARVEAMMPEYRAQRDWLKANGHLLSLETISG